MAVCKRFASPGPLNSALHGKSRGGIYSECSAFFPRLRTLRAMVREELRYHMGQGSAVTAASLHETSSAVSGRSAASSSSSVAASRRRRKQRAAGAAGRGQRSSSREGSHRRDQARKAKAESVMRSLRPSAMERAQGYQGRRPQTASEAPSVGRHSGGSLPGEDARYQRLQTQLMSRMSPEFQRQSARVSQLSQAYKQARVNPWQTTNPMSKATAFPMRHPQQHSVPIVVCGGTRSRVIPPKGVARADMSDLSTEVSSVPPCTPPPALFPARREKAEGLIGPAWRI
jgi:hypothetical protein